MIQFFRYLITPVDSTLYLLQITGRHSLKRDQLRFEIIRYLLDAQKEQFLVMIGLQ